MRKNLLLAVILLAGCLFSVSVFAQKANYKSKELKNVSFDVYRNWELVHERRAEPVRLPGKQNTLFEVAEQTRDRSIPEFVKLMKEKVPDIRKTTFNGYEAYLSTQQGTMYIVFRGNSVFMISSIIESKDKTVADQLKAMMASIRFD